MATDVFLSHDWGDDCSNHTRVSKINDALKKHGYVTWFDNERLTGDIREQMSNGIENTKCCVAFITEDYHEKVVYGARTDNCKLEFNYASNKVAMIAVVLDASMKNPREWKGNIGMSLGLKIYIDMSGDIDDEEYLSRQLIQLKRELSAISIEPSRNPVENSVENRTVRTRDRLEPVVLPDQTADKPQNENVLVQVVTGVVAGGIASVSQSIGFALFVGGTPTGLISAVIACTTVAVAHGAAKVAKALGVGAQS